MCSVFSFDFWNSARYLEFHCNWTQCIRIFFYLFSYNFISIPFAHANVRLIFVAHEKLVFNIFFHISPTFCRTNIHSYYKWLVALLFFLLFFLKSIDIRSRHFMNLWLFLCHLRFLWLLIGCNLISLPGNSRPFSMQVLQFLMESK